MLSESAWRDLIAAARLASANAYAPYSRFAVGAAVRTVDGRTFSGCNVENASFGLAVCAERTAIFNAVAGGAREIVALALYTPTATLARPCGACRQVLLELGRAAEVLCVCDGSERALTTASALLPDAFVLPNS
jgi:cytidine deaminase